MNIIGTISGLVITILLIPSLGFAAAFVSGILGGAVIGAFLTLLFGNRVAPPRQPLDSNLAVAHAETPTVTTTDMTKRLSFEVIFARRLFEQLHNNIEPFNEQEFPNLVDALKRMNIPLSELRKETFVLWSFAFHLMLNNSALQTRGDLTTISQGFDALCSDFVTLQQEYGGDPKDFFTRRHRYETSVSEHLKSDSAGSNISEPILKVIFPVLMAHASEEILYDDAATLRRTVDKDIEIFLELCGVCLEDMRKAKLIDSTL